jgi:LysM repeat protein
MRRLLFFSVIFLLIHPASFATGDSLRYLIPGDTIFLSIGYFGEKVFEHQIEKKQTLFSLARFYGLSVEELYYFNPGLKDRGVALGEHIRVPIPNRAIMRYQPEDFSPWKHVPVFYVVKKGDTMYRISKVYFRMPIDTVRLRAGVENNDLKVGQLIQVGWMSIEGIPEEYREFVGGPLERRNHAMKEVYMRTKSGEREQRGVACWRKDAQESSDLYALHREAPINSVIEVNNPMTGRTVYVKVIGRIPDTAYGNNVKVVLSPIAANLLGARDPRFYVKVKYSR